MAADDPRTELQAKDVKTRAKAAREVALIGSFDDIAQLVEMARSDKSPSVRLYTAAAAADILARHRGAKGQKKLTKAQKEQVLQWATSADPGINPSLLMLLSAAPSKTTLARLGRMLRDPRNGVRAGAVAAVRRMAISSAAIKDQAIPKAVDEWLNDKRIPFDVGLELIKLVGELGWDLIDGVRAAAARAVAARPDSPHPEVADEAIGRVQGRDDPATWAGLYEGEGRDVLEVGKAKDVGWFVLTESAHVDSTGERPFHLEEGRLSWEDGPELRLVWAQALGGIEVFPAVQGDGQTWWRRTDKNLVKRAEARMGELTPAAADAVAAWLGEVEGAAAPRVRAMALAAAGKHDEAAEAFEALLGAKKPRADLYFHYGKLQLERGKKKEGKAALKSFLSKGAKKSPLRPEAEKLIG